MINLTLEEQATNAATLHHIMMVNKNLHKFCKELIDRGDRHDASKLESPEVEHLAQWTPKLAGVTYGSKEYNEFREKLKPALDHHYANNSHHPEHYKDGINDMDLLDIIELFADWAASCKRHNDGNLHKSIEKNAVRFDMSPQLVKIFENTVSFLEN